AARLRVSSGCSALHTQATGQGSLLRGRGEAFSSFVRCMPHRRGKRLSLAAVPQAKISPVEPRPPGTESPLFELLFKYSEETFERSELIFASGWPTWLLVVLCVAAAAVVGVVIARRRAGLPWGKAATIGALQWAMLALLFVLAWRPALVTQTLRPQENSIALLLDTSGSMARADDRTSGSRLQLAIEGLTEKALPGLDKFDLR